MINEHYKILEELKQELTNSGLREAIEILEAELERSEQAIKENFEKRR